jgi:predicted transcriptional regulator
LDNKEKVQVLVKTKNKMTNHTLPKEVGDSLRSLPLRERRAYATKLSNAGWTLQSIANELGLTREAIRLYEKATSNDETEVQLAIKNLPIPELPKVEVYRERIKKVEPTPELIAQLKELHSKAVLVRGKGKLYREEAEQFTKLLYEAVESGISTYRIAKEIGVTVGALSFRLVRYGYKTTNGKSYSYRQLTHRKKNNNA